MTPRFPLVLVCLSFLAVGCEPSPSNPDAATLDAGADGGDRVPALGEWIAIEPGGDTICSRGTPYQFFVRGGRPDRVIIDFQGGGACWNELTCGFAGAAGLFTETAGNLETFVAATRPGGPLAGGMLSDDAANPFRDWTIVHVPYCTGDVHWGNARTVYGEAGAIEHRGFVNASAALSWTYAHYTAPDNVLVSGCSAGAYGAVLHSAYIAQHYAPIDASIAVFADSGAGIITDTFLNDSLPNWNAQANLPSAFVPGLAVPITELALPDVYIEIGRTFPDMRLAQTQSQYDQDQVFFYTAMGGSAVDWPGRMRGSIDAIRAEIPNFTAYVPGGSVHCSGIYPFFTTRTVGGVVLSDWVEELALGATQPLPVLCEGAGCCNDEVCASCAALPADGRPGYCRFCDNFPGSWAECTAP